MIEVIRDAQIRAISAAVPRRSVPITESSLQGNWDRLRRMSGIERRRICPPEMFWMDLALPAAQAALEAARWEPSSVSILTVVTQTPDLQVPAMACMMQGELGLPQHTAAKDINLGCSGYVYGLVDVSRHLCEERPRALLVVGEITGKLKEPIYAPIFGDAVTATAVELSPLSEMIAELRTDGSRWSAISERKFCGRPGAELGIVDGKPVLDTHYELRGPDIYKFAVTEVPQAVRRVADASGYAVEDLDALVLHQANRTINETLRKRLGLTEEQVPSTLRDFGNTSSATIPLTLHQRCASQLREGGMSVMLCGFGVGLSWATAWTRLGVVEVAPLVEV